MESKAGDAPRRRPSVIGSMDVVPSTRNRGRSVSMDVAGSGAGNTAGVSKTGQGKTKSGKFGKAGSSSSSSSSRSVRTSGASPRSGMFTGQWNNAAFETQGKAAAATNVLGFTESEMVNKTRSDEAGFDGHGTYPFNRRGGGQGRGGSFESFDDDDTASVSSLSSHTTAYSSHSYASDAGHSLSSLASGHHSSAPRYDAVGRSLHSLHGSVGDSSATTNSAASASGSTMYYGHVPRKRISLFTSPNLAPAKPNDAENDSLAALAALPPIIEGTGSGSGGSSSKDKSGGSGGGSGGGDSKDGSSSPDTARAITRKGATKKSPLSSSESKATVKSKGKSRGKHAARRRGSTLDADGDTGSNEEVMKPFVNWLRQVGRCYGQWLGASRWCDARWDARNMVSAVPCLQDNRHFVPTAEGLMTA